MESHGVGLHQCSLLFAQALIGVLSSSRKRSSVLSPLGASAHRCPPQVFQKVIVSAGGREAGRKSLPIVYATGNSAACVTVAGIPSNSATSCSLAKCIVVQTDPRPRDRRASKKLQPAGMIDAQADAAA